MQPATIQPELYSYIKGDDLTGKRDRPFAPVCLLNHRYYLEEFPEYYFIVRDDKHFDDSEFERVCLYQEGVVNEYLHPDGKPFTLWLANELRNNRHIETIYRHMEEKVEALQTRDNLLRKNKSR